MAAGGALSVSFFGREEAGFCGAIREWSHKVLINPYSGQFRSFLLALNKVAPVLSVKAQHITYEPAAAIIKHDLHAGYDWRFIVAHSAPRLAKLTAKHYIPAMAKGPKGERRPADVNQRAVMIAKIATGELEDVTTDDGKNAAAVALGRMGGKARAKGLSAKRRKEIAKKAAKSRWK